MIGEIEIALWPAWAFLGLMVFVVTLAATAEEARRKRDRERND
ncbi:hypothetical protein [Maricaulis maris]|uniref:Heme exporter protein D n=1 Tax=Maricaulis maris TaxID=74318 RepID=A0A495DM48_9PROT|nr:hypothetical protein [Maricaulis maris]RKR03996.1 hypothetical protein C7435_0439 [Maricaulis maris]